MERYTCHKFNIFATNFIHQRCQKPKKTALKQNI